MKKRISTVFLACTLILTAIGCPLPTEPNSTPAPNSSYSISTFAGNGVGGNFNGVGTAAGFNGLEGIVSDGTALYVADSFNAQIRKVVIATGVVSTFAGSGTQAYADGVGLNASFMAPKRMVCDGTNLFVTDGNKIRKIVLSSALVSTVAGSGTYVVLDGTGSGAGFKSPYGIATDGLNLYVAEAGGNNVRRIGISTGVVSTIAGHSVAGSDDGVGTVASFNSPLGLAIDGQNLYIADYGNNKIRKLDLTSNAVTTFAGSGAQGTSIDGAGIAAAFYGPTEVIVDGLKLVIADNSVLRQAVIATGQVTWLAGKRAADSTLTWEGAANLVTIFPKAAVKVGSTFFFTEACDIRKLQ